jgi:RNA polymerase sigma-70 factor (ECF subfamily)
VYDHRPQQLQGLCQEVERARRDRQAFRPLFEHYHQRVFAYVASRVGRNQDAEDITAEVFQRAIRGLKNFVCEHEGSFPAWLFRIAQREVARAFSTQARSEREVAMDELPNIRDGSPDVETQVQRREQFAHLRHLIAQLSPRRQEIVTLRFYGELRNRDIAIVLGIDEHSVSANLSRALDDLQRMMKMEEHHVE